MPGYATRAPKGKRKSRRHHGSSPVRRQEVPVTEQTMEQDPFCAYMLCAAQETDDAEMAEHFRQTAVRVWEERHPHASLELPPMAVGSSTREEDSAPLLVFPEEEETGEPILVGAGAFALTPPEDEFGEADSPSEEEDETYPPSEYSESTLDYGEAEGEDEEDARSPSVCSTPTTGYSEGEEEDETYPPSEYSESTVDYGEVEGENEDTSSLPSSHTFSTERHDAEEDVSPPPSVYSVPTVYYGEGKDASRPSSVCSSPFMSEVESEGVDSASGRSGSTVHLRKEVPRPEGGPELLEGGHQEQGQREPRAAQRACGRNPKTGGTPPPAPPAPPAASALPGGTATPFALGQAAGAMPWLPVPMCLSIPLCLPNFLFPFVPLVFHVPVCVCVLGSFSLPLSPLACSLGARTRHL
ncbi:uncharacterized protein LOC143482898 [Brachyhypopomus gauderio]|uniref:uncharacterized protein LOC143482898 n=1 Tax=Brachyhypopomus gauderio TaxID=698409 RepID=UPI0040413117